MFNSLATRTSVQSFSISSMVRIITMLCHRSGDSKCLPNLGRERARIRREAGTGPAGTSTALPPPEPELHTGQEGRGESVRITALAPAASPSRVCVELAKKGKGQRTQARLCRGPGTPFPKEAFPKPRFPFMDSVT